jgi:diguanylate cyclase (GGDEF)-like protein
MRRQDETLLLEKMAYKDFLTGGFNRSAYERDIQSYIDAKKQFRLILLDLNDLKLINDTYGHSQGDEAIRIVFKSMEYGFKSGVCYRIGGDEFAVILNDINPNRYHSCVIDFLDRLKESTINFVYPLHVAIGSDVYDSNVWEYYGKFYHHVDQKMYEHKIKIKSADNFLS